MTNSELSITIAIIARNSSALFIDFISQTLNRVVERGFT